jgi:hypothetical protein
MAIVDADLGVVRSLLDATDSMILRVCLNPIIAVLRDSVPLRAAIYAAPETNLVGWRALDVWLEKPDAAAIPVLLGVLAERIAPPLSASEKRKARCELAPLVGVDRRSTASPSSADERLVMSSQLHSTAGRPRRITSLVAGLNGLRHVVAVPFRRPAPDTAGSDVRAESNARHDGSGGAVALPWYVRAILVRPTTVRANLERVCATYELPQPNEWQLCLGILRLWHRLIFRTETVGTSNSGAVRPTLRARLLAWRALRLPFLLAERAVVPLDFSGLGSSPERLIRHLIGAHHDNNQFVYDLEVLGGYGRLEQLRAEVTAVIDTDTARSRFLRDLTVFEGYHESLRAAVELAVNGRGPQMTDDEAGNPDISLRAYLRWCADQPATPRATIAAWRAGAFRFDSPLAFDSAGPR